MPCVPTSVPFSCEFSLSGQLLNPFLTILYSNAISKIPLTCSRPRFLLLSNCNLIWLLSPWNPHIILNLSKVLTVSCFYCIMVNCAFFLDPFPIILITNSLIFNMYNIKWVFSMYRLCIMIWLNKDAYDIILASWNLPWRHDPLVFFTFQVLHNIVHILVIQQILYNLSHYNLSVDNVQKIRNVVDHFVCYVKTINTWCEVNAPL